VNFASGLRPQHPARLLLVVAVSIFLVEFVFMVMLRHLPPMSYWQVALIDSLVLVLVLFPVLYTVVFRTMAQQLADLKAAEGKMLQMNQSLEARVAERTGQLTGALEEATAANEKIDDILQSVSDGLLVLDGQGRIELLNSAARELLGGPSSIGQSLPEAFGMTQMGQELQTLLSGNRDRKRFDLHCRSHERVSGRILQGRISPRRSRADQEAGVIVTMYDVTREREIERLKSEFVSTAAHEFRTPLATIYGFAELLLAEEGLERGQRNECLSYILEKADTLSALVDDLLDLSRIESGEGLVLRRAAHDLPMLVRDAAATFAPRTGNHRWLFTFEEPAVLEVDRERLTEVLENLFSNALKFSPAGGDIKVAGCRQGDFYRLAVTDQGIGMTAEQVGRAFERFYRGDATDSAIPGTGLGLSIAKGLIEMHGGEIWMESTLHKGTTAYFTLPTTPRQG
jgi:PAS domain S-box-containing protein